MDNDVFHPSFTQFCQLAKQGNLIPVFTEVLADTKTPVLTALQFSEAKNMFLLESVEGREKWATYSFLGINPKMIFSCKGSEIEIREGDKLTKKKSIGNPLNELQKILEIVRPVHVEGVPRFHGGAVGYLGYDGVRFLALPQANPGDLHFPDAVFFITDTLIVFNNLTHQIQIIANATLPKKADKKALRRAYDSAIEAIMSLKENLEKPVKPLPRETLLPKVSKPKALMSKGQYMRIVEKAKEYVRNGDIIQVVLSNRYEGETNLNSLRVYRALRLVNPSPYMYFFRFGDLAVVGSSPETLVRLEEGKINVRPIAGTRPRGKTEGEDQKLERDLLGDAKELAEHVMLVDLGRNDVGRVAEKGSVEVTEFKKVERYSHVMHLVSNVQAILAKGKNAFDLLTATFPAGTLTGAPKLRAMEIIDELEIKSRGPYGGALGYISFSGNMDLCITIRTLFLDRNRYVLQAGAGIVADSVPKLEFQECENKAQAVLKALDLAKTIR